MKSIIELSQQEKGEFLRNIGRWDSQTLAIEYKKKVMEYIRTGEGRFFVEGYLLGQFLLKKEGQTSFFNDFLRFEDFMELMQLSAPSMLLRYIFSGKVFTMTSPVYDLLVNTKNKVFLRKHPFYVFAIDQKVKTKYEGLNILFSIFFEVSTDNKEPKGCNYLLLGRDERDDTEYYVTGDISSPLKDSPTTESFSKEENIELHKKARELYANFLDYLNHPYAKQTLYKLSENNRNRIKRGKFPNQDKIVIDIKPEFFEVRKINSQNGENHYKYKFWVRGHFKHFRNKERYKKIYSLTEKELEKKKIFYNGDFLSRFILPYIKGTGELKEKIRRAS